MLPSNVKLSSTDEGFQIEAAEYIYPDSLIGISHYGEVGVIPFALGEFLTHSEKPNCLINTNQKLWTLWTTDEIFAGEPLTIDKRLY